jgi:hypothetical protein
MCVGQNLKDLSGCPNFGQISISHNPNLTSLRGIPPTIEDLYAEDVPNDLGELRNFSLRMLVLNRTKISSLENFPKHVNDLICDKIPLLQLHSKLHESHQIRRVFLSFTHVNEQNRAAEISKKLNAISDPFEFQDWCINNRLRGILMKLNQLFEVKNEFGFDSRYTREKNPVVYDKDISRIKPEIAAQMSSFEGFPKKIRSQMINLFKTKFTNLERIS